MILSAFLLFFLGTIPDPIVSWNHFEKSVRDQMVEKEQAKKEFPALYQDLKALCSKYHFKPASSWSFPIQGYGKKDMGAGGFLPHIRYGSSPIKGYDFYDGNRHGGHPAYDIFIHDINSDSLDDKTGKPVAIVAPVDLLILSIEESWNPDSQIRGGRYVWALDPIQDQIFYFAHMNTIVTHAGDFLTAGSIIGTVGRTGKNATPTRSPTHLHMMVLTVKNGQLIPIDFMPFFALAQNRI
jgi:peptidoglycan LD-endopeptidase LytH